MTIRKRVTLEMWLRDAMNDSEKEGKISMISLVHMIGLQSKELHTTKFGGKAWSPEDLAAMFRGKAEAYAQDLPGVQTFQLLGFYGPSKDPQAYHPFVVSPQTEQAAGGLASESPTEMGKLAQNMRQADMVFSQLYRRQQALDEHSIRVIELMSRNMSTLIQENRDAFSIMKEMLMEKALDEHNHRMTEIKTVRDAKEREKWISFLPMLANTVTGKEIFPQSAADTALFESIVDGIDENAMMMLGQVVKPELMGPLVMRFEQIQKKKNAEAAAKAKALQPTGMNPELEASGETK